MKTETVEIPTAVLSSVETFDELQDWLTAQNPGVIAELRAARREDVAGKFKPWKRLSAYAADSTVPKSIVISKLP